MIRDDSSNARISAAIREAVDVLTPEQIRQNRESLGLTQKQFAKLLGIAEATVSRWETGGQIQQRSLDRLMRLFFHFPAVRQALGDEPSIKELGPRVATGEASAAQPNADPDRALRLSLLADALDRLPRNKEQAAVNAIRNLLDVFGRSEARTR